MLHFFEHIIYNNIIDSITDTIISKFQFGFLANWSTVQLLLIFLNKIHHSHPNHHPTDTLYLDFKKAFDKIPHNKLLSKLWSISITLEIVSLLPLQLLPIRLCQWPGSLSPPSSFWHPLGPLLLNFIIFINDLPASSNILLFTDNTKCTKPIQSSTDSEPTPVWPSHHHLVQQMEHASRQIHIHFFPDSNKLQRYIISNSAISTSNLHKDLSIVISNNPSWTSLPPHYHQCLYLIQCLFTTYQMPTLHLSSSICSQIIY